MYTSVCVREREREKDRERVICVRMCNERMSETKQVLLSSFFGQELARKPI